MPHASATTNSRNPIHLLLDLHIQVRACDFILILTMSFQLWFCYLLVCHFMVMDQMQIADIYSRHGFPSVDYELYKVSVEFLWLKPAKFSCNFSFFPFHFHL